MVWWPFFLGYLFEKKDFVRGIICRNSMEFWWFWVVNCVEESWNGKLIFSVFLGKPVTEILEGMGVFFLKNKGRDCFCFVCFLFYKYKININNKVQQNILEKTCRDGRAWNAFLVFKNWIKSGDEKLKLY